MTLEELAQMGQALIAQAAEERARREAQETAARAERRMARLVELREALQVEDDVWNSLAARVVETVHEVRLEIALFGRTYYPANDLRGWRHDSTLRPVNAQTLAVVAYQAQMCRAKDKAEVLALLNGGWYHDERDYGRARDVASNDAGLWDEPDVQAARRAFLERHRPQTLNDLPADDPWFETWIADGEKLGLDATAVIILRMQVRNYAAILSDITVQESGDDGSVDAAQELQDWIERLPTERCMPVLAEGVQYQTRLSEARARLKTRVRGEEQRQRVSALEAAAFYPFRYFKVYYGVMVEHYDDEDPPLIQEAQQVALTYPSPDGEYLDEHGHLIRALHLTRIESVDVWTLAEMPWFTPRLKAEEGTMYRVPPFQCRKLSVCGCEESECGEWIGEISGGNGAYLPCDQDRDQPI